MKEISAYLTIILIIIYSISLGYGVNLRKWSGWIFVILGFMLGIVMGVNVNNMIFGIIVGIFCALCLIVFGPIMLRRRQQ